LSKILSQIEEVSAKEAPLTITRGRKHEHLGILLDFREKGKVKIHMTTYVKSFHRDVLVDMVGLANTSAAAYLLQVKIQSLVPLAADICELFHTLVAKILYYRKQGWPDILVAISFLCTRVKYPDVDDYWKLGQVVKYLRKIFDLKLTLERDNLYDVRWWVDASYS
jgi:hypothetical protein